MPERNLGRKNGTPEQKAATFKDIAEHLASGYALHQSDIPEFAKRNGWPNRHATFFYDAVRKGKFTQDTGVRVETVKVFENDRSRRPRAYWIDASLNREQIDLFDRDEVPAEKTQTTPKQNNERTSGLSWEQLMEVSRLHDMAFEQGLEGSITAIAGREMPYVNLHKPKASETKS